MSDPQPVAGVILAAGMSQRFGHLKQLSSFEGRPLLAWVLQAALASRLARVVLVLGHAAAAVRAVLGRRLETPRLAVVEAPDYREGLSRSLQAGLAPLRAEYAAVMFLTGDQPRLDSGTIDLLLERFEASPADICVPVWEGRRGNPVIFGRRFFPDLMALTGDTGGRDLIRRHPEAVLRVAVASAELLADIDTPADLEALRRKGKP